MYKDIAKNLDNFVIKYPNTIVPSPKETDYEIGFIRRYFLRKAIDTTGHIFEVNQSVYSEYTKNPFWIGVTIKWRISGPINAVYNIEGKLEDKGVIDSNKGSIADSCKIIKNINLYLPNLLQFYKG